MTSHKIQNNLTYILRISIISRKQKIIKEKALQIYAVLLGNYLTQADLIRDLTALLAAVISVAYSLQTGLATHPPALTQATLTVDTNTAATEDDTSD